MTIRRHEFIELSIPGPGLLHANLHSAINRVSIVSGRRPGIHSSGSLCAIWRVAAGCLQVSSMCLLNPDASAVHGSGICSLDSS